MYGKNTTNPVFDQKRRNEVEPLAWRNLPALFKSIYETASNPHPTKRKADTAGVGFRGMWASEPQQLLVISFGRGRSGLGGSSVA